MKTRFQRIVSVLITISLLSIVGICTCSYINNLSVNAKASQAVKELLAQEFPDLDPKNCSAYPCEDGIVSKILCEPFVIVTSENGDPMVINGTGRQLKVGDPVKVFLVCEMSRSVLIAKNRK